MGTKYRSSDRTRRQAEWLAREAQRRRLTLAAWVAAGLVLVGALGYLVWKELQPEPEYGERIPIQGTEHIEVGQQHEPYNSDPPTSGPHYAEPAEAGFYEEAPADEALVHNLEHGHVIIWYNCTPLDAAGCESLKQDIQRVMAQAGRSPLTGTPKVEAVPRPGMETLLAVTSWGRLDRLDRFDANRILNFIRANRDDSPEPSAP